MELDSLAWILQYTHHTLLSRMDLNIASDNVRDKNLPRGCEKSCSRKFSLEKKDRKTLGRGKKFIVTLG